MKFYKLKVNCSTTASDEVSYVLHDAGSLGEVFDDYNIIKNVLEEKRWDYADESLFEKTSDCSVSGFYTIETDISLVKSRIESLKQYDFADFSSISTEITIIDSIEWENEWKKYYKPFNIGKIVIIPEWLDHRCSNGEIPVLLNPGPAFGTGTHETTSMCIEAMQDIVIAGKRVLDFGCGSGILGICAQKLGAGSVIFADTDEQAVSATIHNCRLNGIIEPTVLQNDVRSINEPADVVLANITADVLIDVEGLIAESIGAGGYAILSGVISEKAEAVQIAYKKDFSLVKQAQKNKWRAFLFRKS